jgi:HK97 family phage portal protein
MKFTNPFRREKRAATKLEEILIKSGVLTSKVSKDQALSIPVFAACVDLISNTIASLPVHLYKQSTDTTEMIEDNRAKLLNAETGDTLDGFQMKKAWVTDYLCDGAGYIYINRSRNNVKSLNYVEQSYVSINYNFDPIFKKGEILVYGQTYRDFEFLKLLRHTKNGFDGTGIVDENNKMLSIAFNQMIFEDALVRTGGSKKGFLKAQGKLSKEALDELKKGWKDLYSADSENVLVLNNGLDFQEASLTSVELQLNENKITNADTICKMFLVPPSLLAGTASDKEYLNWIKVCISPIISAMEVALNKDLLLPSEQGNKVFCADTSELLKADVETRFKAYEIGIKNAIYQIDEVRHKENLPPLDLKFLKMGLQDVLYWPDTQEIYTPNTNSKYDINQAVDPNQQQANQPNVATGVQNQTNEGGDNMPNKPNDSLKGNSKAQGGAKGENVQSGAGPNTKNKQSTNNGKKG